MEVAAGVDDAQKCSSGRLAVAALVVVVVGCPVAAVGPRPRGTQSERPALARERRLGVGRHVARHLGRRRARAQRVRRLEDLDRRLGPRAAASMSRCCRDAHSTDLRLTPRTPPPMASPSSPLSAASSSSSIASSSSSRSSPTDDAPGARRGRRPARRGRLARRGRAGRRRRLAVLRRAARAQVGVRRDDGALEARREVGHVLLVVLLGDDVLAEGGRFSVIVVWRQHGAARYDDRRPKLLWRKKAHEPQRLLVCARSWRRYKTFQLQRSAAPSAASAYSRRNAGNNDSPLGPSVLLALANRTRTVVRDPARSALSGDPASGAS